MRWDLPAHVVDRRIRARHAEPGRVDDDRRSARQARARSRSTNVQTTWRPGVIRVERDGVSHRHGIAAGAARPDPAAGQEADERRRLGPRRPSRRIRASPMTKPRTDARRDANRSTRPASAAFDVLRAVSERDAYANLALPALLRERGITGRDAAFATELTYGTCRTRGLLDAIIGAAAGRPPRQIDPVLLDLLRLGAYQLLRTRVEHHAAVSTTVEQAGIEFDSARAGFVNGVLRTIAGATNSPGSRSSPRPPTATRSGTPRSCMPIRAGSRRRSPTPRRGRRGAGRAAGQRRRTPVGASRRAARRADRRRAGRAGRRHGRPLLAVRRLPARRRPRSARAGPRRRRAGAGRGQPAGGAGADAGRPGRTRRGPMARPVLRARRQDGAAGRARHDESAACTRSPRSSPPRSRADMVEQNTRGLPVEVLRVDGRDPGSNRDSTACWSTRRAPGWVRCGAGRRPAGGANPATCRAGQAAARAAGLGDPADPARRCGAVRDVLAASGRDGRRRRRRAAPPPGHARWTPGRCSTPSTSLGDGPYVQLWPHRHGTDAMFAAALKVG